MLPKWVLDNPQENMSKISSDQDIINKDFPGFMMLQGSDGGLFVKGGLISTGNKDRYEVELYYPDDYPHSPLRAVIRNPEVISVCSSIPKDEMHYLYLDEGGIEIDLKITYDYFYYPISYYIFWILAWIHFFESKTVKIN